MTLTTAQGHLNWYKTNKAHYTWFCSAWLQLITSCALCMILLSMTAAHHFMCIIHDFTQHDCSSSCALRMILFSMTAAHHFMCITLSMTAAHHFMCIMFSMTAAHHFMCITLSMTAAHHFMCIMFSMTAAHHSLCIMHDFAQHDCSSSLPVQYAWFCSAWLQLITSCASPRTANDMYANMQLSNSMCCSITCRTLQYMNWNETDLIS